MTHEEEMALRELAAGRCVIQKVIDTLGPMSLWSVDGMERELDKARAEERNKLAAWMIARGYATGHGDTTEDLLRELEWQIAESWTNALVKGVEGEREACAQAAGPEDSYQDEWFKAKADSVRRIRARGQA